MNMGYSEFRFCITSETIIDEIIIERRVDYTSAVERCERIMSQLIQHKLVGSFLFIEYDSNI